MTPTFIQLETLYRTPQGEVVSIPRVYHRNMIRAFENATPEGATMHECIVHIIATSGPPGHLWPVRVLESYESLRARLFASIA